MKNVNGERGHWNQQKLKPVEKWKAEHPRFVHIVENRCGRKHAWDENEEEFHRDVSGLQANWIGGE
jgi:hypothetical protein